ncbi:SDR family NAD(P)-dependent oxidoreductase [Actinacidiphila sp. bgisy144]|uniref:SDR family NAD(P)-dependent oxidoreductase n=1 Tax=unclassified Actinacidiphila TaxID=2995708 RepID=UPI003EBFCD0B
MSAVLNGKIAVVTGASQGIGKSVARRFAEEGAKLVMSELHDGVHAAADEIAAAFPQSDVIAVVTDVTDPSACAELMATASERHGGLDILAHATAVMPAQSPTAETSVADWDRTLAVNAKGAFLLARSAIPVLRRPGGTIVFTGSYAGEVGLVGRAIYCASKGALRTFSQSLALELAGEGIRVNAVAPAHLQAELNSQMLEITSAQEGISVEEAQARRNASIPMGREATADEVAEGFVYLASGAASYVTGAWLDVNGGAVMR